MTLAVSLRNKILAPVLVLALCASILSACAPGSLSGDPALAASGSPTAAAVKTTGTPAASSANTAVPGTTAAKATSTPSTTVSGDNSASTGPATASITLAGKTITVNGTGASVDGSRLTITSAGTYSISGTLTDGQIIVDTQDKETVRLLFNGVDIACSTTAPIYVVKAEKVIITLADGTDNRVTDGKTYLNADPNSDDPNAAIFSHDDLTINGNGSMTVTANYNNGIQSKDDLRITGGIITVVSVNDGLKGRDSVVIRDATITVNAGGDGIQSTNDVDAERGTVSIESGTIHITAGEDGIQSETKLLITGGDITISSGGGSANASTKTGGTWGNWGPGRNTTTTTSTGSAKGLKAGVDLTIDGGTITIDSSDDSLHSNGTITINGGVIVAASGDDGMHADTSVTINGGELSITKSYEGIESAVVTINDGIIRVVSSDDGINIVGGVDGSGMGGRPGQGTFNYSGSNYLYINGGYLAIDAGGDGIDANGAVVMTGGVVIVNGPTENMNGALDHMGFKITGGFLVAVGSSGMAQAPDTTSTQYSVMMNFSSAVQAGTIIRVQTQDGKDIVTFAPAKTFQSVVVSSPELTKGATYVVYGGGTSTGTLADSLYSGGTYSGGTQITSFTISSILTTLGSSGGARR